MVIIYIFFIGFLCHSLYGTYNLKTKYRKVAAVCIDFCRHSYFSNGHRNYTHKGLYKYNIDGKEYITLDEKSRKMRKPKIDQPTKLYVRKDNPERFIPKASVDFWNACTAVMGFMVLLDVIAEIIRINMI